MNSERVAKKLAREVRRAAKRWEQVRRGFGAEGWIVWDAGRGRALIARQAHKAGARLPEERVR